MKSGKSEKAPVTGGSVVEREAQWRPDAGIKPVRVLLNFCAPPDRLPRGGLRMPSGAWTLAVVALAAGWVGVGS